MARLQCRACGFDGDITWDGQIVCPRCGSTHARVALRTEEISDEHLERILATWDAYVAMPGEEPEDE